MTVRGCLDSAHAQGEITRADRDALLHLYNSLLDHYGNADQARAEMVERLMAEANHRRRQAHIAEDARTRVEGFLTGYRNARGEPDPAAALVLLLEHNGQTRMPEGLSSVRGREQAIIGLAMARLEGLVHEFRRTVVLGRTRETARLENVVREARGEATNDPAAAHLARAWSETAEWLRQRFNAAGGAIGHLENWGLPQVHDRRALLATGMDGWISAITPRLDPERMRHPLTGRAMTPEDLRGSLEWIWRNITSDGWADREATAQRRGLGAVSGQRADHRFLVFRSADDWLAYNRDFGGGADPFGAMMDHVRGMARDIAAMEVLGPNPASMLVYMQNFVTRQAALRVSGDPDALFAQTTRFGRQLELGGSWARTANPEDYARSMVKLSQDMWDLHRGAAGAVVNQRISDVFGTVRNLNVASKLGSATLSAVTDVGFQQMARGFAGLPVARTFTDYLAQVRQGTRREAAAAGLIVDSALHVLRREARNAGPVIDGMAWSQVLADRVIAWSGLQAFTQAGRHAFGLSFMATLRQHAEMAHGDLPPRLRRTLERYGIGPTEWDAARAVTVDEHFLRPADIERAHAGTDLEARRVADRMLEMILQETEYAVPQGTLRAQASAYGGLKRGTVRDEFWRSSGQFKMFGISVAMLQAQRAVNTMIEDGMWRGAGYAATLLIVTTLYGALAMQLKEMSKGKEPRPMFGDKKQTAAFWGGALLQGGGLGIFGDFLASETSRTGGGWARMLAGPTGDLMASVLGLTIGNAVQGIRDEKTNTGRELVRFLGQNTPGGSLWYLRAAYERMVLDRLQRLADPEAYQAFRRQILKTRREQGNDYVWEPGQPLPKGF